MGATASGVAEGASSLGDAEAVARDGLEVRQLRVNERKHLVRRVSTGAALPHVPQQNADARLELYKVVAEAQQLLRPPCCKHLSHALRLRCLPCERPQHLVRLIRCSPCALCPKNPLPPLRHLCPTPSTPRSGFLSPSIGPARPYHLACQGTTRILRGHSRSLAIVAPTLRARVLRARHCQRRAALLLQGAQRLYHAPLLLPCQEVVCGRTACVLRHLPPQPFVQPSLSLASASARDSPRGRVQVLCRSAGARASARRSAAAAPCARTKVGGWGERILPCNFPACCAFTYPSSARPCTVLSPAPVCGSSAFPWPVARPRQEALSRAVKSTALRTARSSFRPLAAPGSLSALAPISRLAITRSPLRLPLALEAACAPEASWWDLASRKRDQNSCSRRMVSARAWRWLQRAC